MIVKQAVSVLFISLLSAVADGTKATAATLRLPVYESAGQFWVGKNGKLQGFRLKVLDELNDRLKKDDLKLEYVMTKQGQLPIQLAMQEILAGKYEAYFGLIYSKAREDEGIKFGKVEMYSIPTVVWTKKSDNFRYTGLASLKGKRIGIVAGYPYLDNLEKPDFAIDRSALNDEANIKNLLAGKVDAIIDNLTRTGMVAIRLKVAGQMTYADEPFGISKFLIAYNKNVSDDVVRKIDAALDDMHKSGVIKKILDEAIYMPLKH